MCKGKDSDVSLYIANLDVNNNQWSPWTSAIPGNTGPDSTTLLAAPGGSASNYPMADSKGANVIGAVTTITITEDIIPDNQAPIPSRSTATAP